ncbi:MAG TPA: hypothetical protein PLB91_05485 [Spirochaetales bacterium]|nr:hypothetical protein [Spirochaetales bacterium]HRY54934.1 hypothetical protein [Spirochaetia bacterium]HRZ65280.1 hypothetical protein [Spirochaetia bacterium]
MQISETSFVVDLDFEAIKLPPVTDILVLGKKVPQGKMGVLHSFQLISPDSFEMIEVEGERNVEAIIISKSLLTKLRKEQVLDILSEYVFPYVARGESIKVNFDVHIFQRNIKGELHAGEDVSPN